MLDELSPEYPTGHTLRSERSQSLHLKPQREALERCETFAAALAWHCRASTYNKKHQNSKTEGYSDTDWSNNQEDCCSGTISGGKPLPFRLAKRNTLSAAVQKAVWW